MAKRVITGVTLNSKGSIRSVKVRGLKKELPVERVAKQLEQRSHQYHTDKGTSVIEVRGEHIRTIPNNSTKDNLKDPCN